MRWLARAIGEYLKEVGWGLFLIYLFLGIIALLVGRYLEYETAAWVCLGLGALVTLIIGSMIPGNLIWILVSEAIRRLRRQPKKRGTPLNKSISLSVDPFLENRLSGWCSVRAGPVFPQPSPWPGKK